MTMKKKDIIEGKIIKTEFPNKGTFICEDQKVTVKGVIDYGRGSRNNIKRIFDATQRNNPVHIKYLFCLPVPHLQGCRLLYEESQ